jgi:hypothetical protein
MKHTDFHSLMNEIKRREREELYKAIEAHGGEYSWGEYNEDGDWEFENADYPIITANISKMLPAPMDIDVTNIYIENGLLKMEGEGGEWGDIIDFRPEEVFTGHLSYITDLIPATEQVSDVSSKKSIKTRVLFGRDAVCAFQEGPDKMKEFFESQEGYGYEEKEFATSAEKDAYLSGINDYDGWEDFLVLEDSDELPESK